MSPGEITIAVNKAGYDAWTNTFQVAAGQALAVPVTLRQSQTPDNDPTGTLTLNVPGGTLSVDGEPSCRAGSPCTVTAGTKRVTFRHPLHGTATRNVTVRAGRQTSDTFYFERTVVVAARTEDGTDVFAAIFVNGQTADGWTTPKVFDDWAPGTYTVEVRKQGYVALTDPQQVVIPDFGEQRVPLVFRLRPE